MPVTNCQSSLMPAFNVASLPLHTGGFVITALPGKLEPSQFLTDYINDLTSVFREVRRGIARTEPFG